MRRIAADALPRSLVKTYHEYAFEPVDKRGSFAYDSAAEWAACAAHFAAVVRDGLATINDPALASQEWETVEKGMVCWRDKGLGALVVADETTLNRSNEEQAQHLRRRFVRLGGEYAAMVRRAPIAVLSSLMAGSEVPINKGKGPPYWYPGSDRQSAVALAAVIEDSRTAEGLLQAVRIAGNAVLPIMITSYMRTQGSRKWLDEWALTGGELNIVGQRRGAKIRRVQALPFVVNYLVSQVAPVLRWCLVGRTNRNTGTIHYASRAVREYKYSAAVDLASYDESVGIETLELYRQLVLSPVYSALRSRGLLTDAEVGILLDLDTLVQYMPLLAPPRNPLSGADLFDRRGGIVSGERLTSQKGNDINRERIDAKADFVGLVGAFFNAGDDTVICTDDKAAFMRYLDLTVHDGFTETVSDDTSFLMKRLPHDYAYLARMLFNTLNRESSHEPNSYALAAAGIAVRRELLRGHPLEHLYDTALLTGPSPRLKAAASLSRSAPLHDLLLAATTTSARRSDDTESLEETTELALEMGILGQNEYVGLLQRLTALDARSSMRFSELRQAAREMGRVKATNYIQSTAYTTIHTRKKT